MPKTAIRASVLILAHCRRLLAGAKPSPALHTIDAPGGMIQKIRDIAKVSSPSGNLVGFA
ncbi:MULTISPECIES: hypothetical protein [unclassified Paenibacillus]|uniref:hypothetical protein n=1 Tax=unclassified Paenibacillus TaxID=185978 RepID=UPI0015B87614|nr:MULTISPECIES: hypothetical protein [unclassified Paenibacillus]NWL87875.1 hypothetical protein [Paenibacillus sp. 79R4]